MKQLLLLTLIALVSCKKSSFLEKIPDNSLITPSTLEDLERLSINTEIFNGLGNGISPILGEIASDNYYMLPGSLSNLAPHYKNMYTWDDDIYASQKYDWAFPYRAIFYANVILDLLPSIQKNDNNEQYKIIKGRALFYRSEMFFKVAQVFAVPYNHSTAKQDISVPIKLSSDVNEAIYQSTNEQLYRKILDDLQSAGNLLPTTSSFKNQPSKASAYGLLSRVYLNMQMYDSAYFYADKCLSLNNTLLNFSSSQFVKLTSSPAFEPFNPEIIFSSVAITSGISSMFATSRYRVDTTLYNSYKTGDLRKTAFYQQRANGYTFKGSYDGTTFFFTGISTNEIYLIKAECAARIDRTQEAMDTLNAMLRTRWDSNIPYPQLNANTKEEAIALILEEKRKELPFRGTRWEDLRRLNLTGANITLKRNVDGQLYQLPPNSPHFTFLIPPDVMTLNPTWTQNPR